MPGAAGSLAVRPHMNAITPPRGAQGFGALSVSITGTGFGNVTANVTLTIAGSGVTGAVDQVTDQEILATFTIAADAAIVILTFSQLILSQKGEGPGHLLSGDVLEGKVPGDSLEYLTTREAFSQGLLLTRSAGGIASAASGCEEEPIIQRWMPVGASLKNVLNWIVTADPVYRWQLDGDIVNLLPLDDEPVLLRTRIDRFRLETPADIDSALNQLLAQPEVKRQANNLNISTGLKLFVRPSSKTDPKITLDCKDLTLREALNAIVRAYGRAVWSYRERSCGGQNVFSIDFIVR
jgi:hypothetical protein